MVKGTTRRVIVVNAPDAELFEQAIFIVRSDAAKERGVSERMLVDEACRVASRSAPPRTRRWSAAPLFWSGLGAGAIAVVWLLTAIL